MATSGSVDFTIDRDTLITTAYRDIGEVAVDATPNSDQTNYASTKLNILIKSWMTKGLNVWVKKRQSITPVASQYSYTLGRSSADVTMDRPLEIIDIYSRVTSTVVDTPLTPLSSQDYWGLSDKDQTGEPVNWYYDAQTTNGVLYVWPAPDATFVASNTLEVLYRKPFDDMDSATDDFDFPQEWYDAILKNLRYELSYNSGADYKTKRQMKEDAMMAFQDVLDWDVEPGSVIFTPGN